MINQDFSVIDIETTGFSPKRGDKIIEIGIIRFDKNGNELKRFETLINPERDVSAFNIHGISAQMVKDAPKFDEVADDIFSLLAESVIVGHNIPFDLRFLNHEFSIQSLIENNMEGLCTLSIARSINLDLPNYKLETLSRYFDIESSMSHSAIGDTEVTSQIFWKFMKEFDASSLITLPSSIHGVRAIFPSGRIYTRLDSNTQKENESSKLKRMLNRLPISGKVNLSEDQYLNALDKILADRIVTDQETNSLLELAVDMGISRIDAERLHKEYLHELTRVYLLDHHLSDSELQDISDVGQLLAIDKQNVNRIIENAKSAIISSPIPTRAIDLEGKSVCFTGELTSKIDGNPISRKEASQMAVERGLIVKNSVGKKLDFLVTADPHSLSGKAKKARDLGVEILAEAVFFNRLGVNVE